LISVNCRDVLTFVEDGRAIRLRPVLKDRPQQESSPLAGAVSHCFAPPTTHIDIATAEIPAQLKEASN
jgi:hypothetical protein